MSALTMEKMAVFAPIESASVRMTVRVKPGFRQSWRIANLRFCPKASIGTPLADEVVEDTQGREVSLQE
jgi:hypothetical protein